MGQYEMSQTGLDQIHLVIKDIYSLVIAVNYTKNTYSVIDSVFEDIPTCVDATDFIKFAKEYFMACNPEDLQNYPLICDFDSLVDHLRNNKGSYHFEVRLEKSPYVFNWYDGTYFLMEDIELADSSLLLLFKDINDQKMIEENLKDAFVANEISAKAKTDFLSRMSQDIRTPISLIVSMIDSARQNIDNKDMVMDFLVKMDISSRYLFQVIDNALDMSKIEAGKFNIDNSPFNLLTVLDEIKQTYSEQTAASDISFVVEEHTKGLTNLIGDAFRVTQVLRNLVSNSFKYAPHGGTVTVKVLLNKVTYNRAFYSFIVQNDGPPLDESQIERFFKPFEKGFIPDGSTVFTGLGLGLSICKNTIELLGGSIRGFNAPGDTGVVFEAEVSFELDEDNVPNDIEFLADYAYIRFPKKNILVAEDDQRTFETIKALLENRGVTVDLAIDGLEAVHAFENSPSGYYDLILMAMDLPMMSGIDTATAIRNSFHENGLTIPIIGMSLDILGKDVDAALAAGMTAHIMKPIDADRLFETLKNYI